MLIEPKIGWIISNDYSVASSRLQGFLIHEYLKENGYNSSIICSNFEILHKKYSLDFFKLLRKILNSSYDVVFFVRPNWMMHKLSELLILSKIKTVAVRCDYVPGNYDQYFNITITPTIELQEALRLERYEVIDDMIEVPQEIYKKNYSNSDNILHLVWVGHCGYKNFIENFSTTLLNKKELKGKIKISTISNGSWATNKWSLDTVYNDIIMADIAIIPMPETEYITIKSANRLTMLMALGMPTIAYPMPSYKKIASNTENCLLATNTDEFSRSILKLQSQPLREKLGTNARKQSIEKYNKTIICSQWLNLILKLFHGSSNYPLKSKIHTVMLNYIFSKF